MASDHNSFANLIWQIADLLRGPYRPPQYERVMLPMTVLRRFDCVLAATKDKVLAAREKYKGGKLAGDALDTTLNRVAGQRFHNHSPLDFARLKGDPDNINKHLVSYIKGFSGNVRRIFEYFEFETEIEKMHEANILYLVVSKFADVDLHPSNVPNEQMGLIFENLIRRFNELANETAGDHFTPREVIRLMVNLLFIHDDELLATAGTVRKLLDPACGTGGMLAEAQRYLREHNTEAKLYAFGQDYNKRAFATAASDMLMKEVNHNGSGDDVRFGDTFTEDQFPSETFDYFLSNPPFGVDWKKQQKEIQREHEKGGFDGRFGAGLPRVNDGALLFLQHMWSKREDVKPKEHKAGSRLAIVFSGSPMFTGGAGSGESDIRKWLLENDWLEAIVALPESMFYNTGIGTYVWVVTNRKEKRRKGKVQLLDARDVWTAGGSEDSKRSLGEKRRHMTVKQIDDIVRLYGKFEEGPRSKIFDNADFGYTRVTIERPLRLRYEMATEDKARFLDVCPHLLDDVQSIDKSLGREPRLDWPATWNEIEALLKNRGSRWKATEQKLFRSVFTQRDAKAKPVPAAGGGSGFEADADLRDFENVPLREDVDAYFEREVRPHVSDVWMDRSKDKVGYEVSFNRHFCVFTRPRSPQEVDEDLKVAEEAAHLAMREVAKLTRMVTRGASEAPLRDSGVTWLGEIPRHWTTRRAGWLFRERDQRGEAELPLLEVSIAEGVVLRDPSSNRNDNTAADLSTCKIARRGDIVFNKMRMWQGAVGVCPATGLVSADYTVASPSEAIDANYAGLLFRTKAFAAECARRSRGIVWDRLRLYWDDFKEIELPLPPLEEQRRIVKFATIETRLLNEMQCCVERLTAIVNERRLLMLVGHVDVASGDVTDPLNQH